MKNASIHRLAAAAMLCACAAPAGAQDGEIRLPLSFAETLEGAPGDGFGSAAATAGDVNGDGFSDVIAGAFLVDDGAEDTNDGRAFIYLGGTGPFAAVPPLELRANGKGPWFGHSAAPAGDVNGDGYDDVLIGTPNHGTTGAAFLHPGSSAGPSPQPSWRVDGTVSGHQLGRSLAGAGDVNGDGLADVIIGDPAFGGDQSRGHAWVYLGSSQSATGIRAEPFWSREGADSENFGWAVAGAGDVNADGLADLIVGSLDSRAVLRAGRAYVFLSRGDGFPQAPDWTVAGTAEQENYGYSVGTAGDVNGDGFSDFLVGAPRPQALGAAFLYAGGAGPLSTVPVWNRVADSPVTSLGQSVATAGDVNGDGYADVAAGEPFHEDTAGGAPPGFDSGRVLVFLGSAGGLSLAPDHALAGSDQDALLGLPVAAAGDVNGDGFGELLAGAPTKDFTPAGKVVVFHGAARLPSTTPAWSAEGNGVRQGLGAGALASAGDVNGDGFGDVVVTGFDGEGVDPSAGVALLFLGSRDGLEPAPARTFLPDQPVFGFDSAGSAGDVDGDGYDEFLLSQGLRQAEFEQEGRVVLYSGGPHGPSERPTWVRDGGRSLARFGTADSAGDVNGDGYGDLVVGAFGYSDAEGRLFGKAFLFHGSPGGLSLTPSWTALGEVEDGYFGWRAVSPGDVNADGYSDVLVGGTVFNPGPNGGRSYLYLGSPGGLSETPAWTKVSPGPDGGVTNPAGGDVNGDGRSDLILGEIFFSEIAATAGRAWLYLGSLDGLKMEPAWFADGDQPNVRFGSIVEGLGDVNRDGYGDAFVGEVGTGLVVDRPSRAFLYLGTPGGLTTTPAWVTTSPQPGDGYGHVGAAGDVNGDGFPDLLVGAYLHDGVGPEEFQEGKVYLYLANGGGLPRRQRQLNSISRTRIAARGRSDSPESFALAMEGRSPAGRDRVRLEWEVKPLGVPFNGMGLGRGAAPADTGAPAAGGRSIELVSDVTGLTPNTPYVWRARIASRNPFFPRSPWLSLPEGNITEAKLRTAPAAPPITNLIGEAIAEGIEVRWQNGAAYEGLELKRDGGATIELAGDQTSYFDAAPGLGRHEYTLIGRFEGLRSPAAGAAATVVAVTELAAGLEAAVVLTPDAPRAWFTFAPRPGSLLRITLADDDPTDANALYARWGQPARASAFDHAAERRFQASQRLVIPYARGEPLSVLAQANVFAGSDNAIRLAIEEVAELALEGLSCRRAGAVESGQRVSAIVSGAGFERAAGATTRFFLEERLEGGAPGRRIEAVEVILVSSSRAEAVFDLSGAPPGSYDLAAVKEVAGAGGGIVGPAGGIVGQDRGAGGGLSVFDTRLAAVFTVTPESRGPLLELQAGGPQVTRARRTTHLDISYANAGDSEMAAPLLLVTAPAGNDIRLASNAEFRGRRLVALGAPANGPPDRLAPGAAGSVPIVFRGDGCDACTSVADDRVACCAAVEVAVFAPPRDAFVGWDRIAAPPGLEEGWESLRSPLSVLLGATWLEFHEALARRARRLARRGMDPRSLLEPFRLAVREARGRPAGAITGVVRFAGSGIPAAGRLIGALVGEEVAATVPTDAGGRFMLEWLAEGKILAIVVEGNRAVTANRGTITGAGAVELAIPSGEDVLGLELEVAAGETADLEPACPGCDESDLPAEPLFPPAELFTLASRWEVGLIGSEDPNEKGGSTGPDDLVGRRPVVYFTVYFENVPQATAPAQRVRIVDPLDRDRLDLSSFRLRDVELGAKSADDESGEEGNPATVAFETEGYGAEARLAILVPASGGPAFDKLDVTVQVDLDLQTGELIWEMSSQTDDVFQGFLHPNDESGRGQGAVSFSLSPRDDISQDDDIRNRASVYFDENARVDTNEFSLPARLFFPENAPRNPRPADGAVQVPAGTGLCWEPVARAAHYEVSFGEAGAEPATVEVAEPCFAPPALAALTTYRWQVTAVTSTGRRAEGPPWSFTTEAPPPGAAGPPRDPAPADGALEVSRGTALSWTAPEPPAGAYEIYFWPAGEGRPVRPAAAGWTATTWQPPRLECGRAYRWQVFARSSPEVVATPGLEWTFTVRGRPYRRGDADGNGSLNITDPILVLNYLFLGGKAPTCLETADGDDSGGLNITDPIYLLSFLFLGGPPPPAPFPTCACPPSESTLSCAEFAACP